MILRDLTKTYDGRRVLELPLFELPANSVCALIGANGSGKSTLARIVAGVETPDDRRSVETLRQYRVGYMPQKNFAFRMHVIRNVLLPVPDTPENRSRALTLLRELQIDHLAAHAAQRLSGGETARMALARVLMCPSDVLVLDEPTAAMDVQSTMLAEELIRRHQRETGCRVLLVTHSLKQARRLAHHVAFLHQGRLAESGPAEQVLTAPAQELTREFLEFYSL
ncbi:MAG: ABC transporter ATP-binding protein [Firmicutes bacterium]|nr:ABC transporter ATP-binding protein [Bacillota bacterium]